MYGPVKMPRSSFPRMPTLCEFQLLTSWLLSFLLFTSAVLLLTWPATCIMPNPEYEKERRASNTEADEGLANDDDAAVLAALGYKQEVAVTVDSPFDAMLTTSTAQEKLYNVRIPGLRCSF